MNTTENRIMIMLLTEPEQIGGELRTGAFVSARHFTAAHGVTAQHSERGKKGFVHPLCDQDAAPASATQPSQLAPP